MNGNTRPGTQYLIVNADDFGYSAEVNAAIVRAHTHGILSSTSLMVAEPGWQEAVALARHHPALGVGLHVTATLDRAVLPRTEIPLLVNAQGKFGADPFLVGLRYAFSGQARAQLRRELEAQFARFAATGLPWSHVDGHQHFHMHPVVWDHLLDLCDQYGAHRLRLPHEELRAHFRPVSPASVPRTVQASQEKNRAKARLGDGPNLNTVFIVFLRAMRRRNLRALQRRRTLGGKPFFVCERVYGQLQTGNMNAEYTLGLLDRLGGATNEIYFHPGAAHAHLLPPDQQTPDVRDVELQALLDPDVRAKIQRSGLIVGNYAQVEDLLSQVIPSQPYSKEA